MEGKKARIKNISIVVLVFIIGFGVGMVFTFQVVFYRLEKYGVMLK